jgi:hypothetical protein
MAVRILPPQPTSPVSRAGPCVSEEFAPLRGFSRWTAVSGLPNLALSADLCQKSPGSFADVPKFMETQVRDRFDLGLRDRLPVHLLPAAEGRGHRERSFIAALPTHQLTMKGAHRRG